MNLVREAINFERGQDPMKAMGIGQLAVFQEKLPRWDLKSMTPNEILVKCATTYADDKKAALQLGNYVIKKMGANQLWYNHENFRGGKLREIVKIISLSHDYASNMSAKYEMVWHTNSSYIGNIHTLKYFHSKFRVLDKELLNEINEIISDCNKSKKILAKFGIK